MIEAVATEPSFVSIPFPLTEFLNERYLNFRIELYLRGYR